MTPTGRVHIRYRNGLDRYDESASPILIDPAVRTLVYMKPDGITLTFPIDTLLFWEYAPIQQANDPRLVKPIVVEPVNTRPEALDWPVDVHY